MCRTMHVWSRGKKEWGVTPAERGSASAGFRYRSSRLAAGPLRGPLSASRERGTPRCDVVLALVRRAYDERLTIGTKTHNI